MGYGLFTYVFCHRLKPCMDPMRTQNDLYFHETPPDHKSVFSGSNLILKIGV